jgi:uncharacterized NAD(P)/FAD-binding protein YdhS
MTEPTQEARSYSCEIAIVGGGCSGVLVAAHLLRNGYTGRIAIIESRAQLGLGLAYSTTFEQHLLNVPAGKMSAFPAEPSHFLEWLRGHGWPGAAPDSFASRMAYGQYLGDILQSSIAARSNDSLQHICAEAVDVHPAAHGVALTLADGGIVEAAKVVLALGNPASSHVDGVSEPKEPWYTSPWLGNALRQPFEGERILLAGTGLTAIDSALALAGRMPACRIYMVSRRGLLPQVHDLRRTPAPPPVFQASRGLRPIFRQLREQIRLSREAGDCWRAVVDSLRPVSNQMWRDLPVADRSRFLRHLRTYWEAHRHRMAPQVAKHIEELRAAGRIEIIAGRIREHSREGDVFEVRIAQRYGGDRRLEVDRAINCTGIHEDYRKAPRRLIQALIRSGAASANDLGLGFRTDSSGALIDAQGAVCTRLFTLGPPRRGDLFETTAVPEIRAQAQSLADHLLGQSAVGA